MQLLTSAAILAAVMSVCALAAVGAFHLIDEWIGDELED